MHDYQVFTYCHSKGHYNWSAFILYIECLNGIENVSLRPEYLSGTYTVHCVQCAYMVDSSHLVRPVDHKYTSVGLILEKRNQTPEYMEASPGSGLPVLCCSEAK